MNEWPKRIGDIYWEQEVTVQEIDPDFLVIPADLGRELYEALNEVEYYPRDKIDAALARYEREVKT